jgi:hypothetical protein
MDLLYLQSAKLTLSCREIEEAVLKLKNFQHDSLS